MQSQSSMRTGLFPWLLALALACGGDPQTGAEAAGQAEGPAQGAGPAGSERGAAAGQGELVTPPFSVSGDLEGLLLVWFDSDGTHTAERLADVPEGQRARVRVDSPSVPPEQRLPPDQIFLADLRKPDESGHFPVRKLPRAAFDAMVDELQAAAAPSPEEVVIYKASWCGVCKQAAAYLRQRKVPFVERDVEKDPTAAAEMQQKAKAAGKTPRGVPVIDFRGHILMGFDRQALESLIAQGG